MLTVSQIFPLSATQLVRRLSFRRKEPIRNQLNRDGNIFLLKWKGATRLIGLQFDGESVEMKHSTIYGGAGGKYERLTPHVGTIHKVLIFTTASVVTGPQGTSAKNITAQRDALTRATQPSVGQGLIAALVG